MGHTCPVKSLPLRCLCHDQSPQRKVNDEHLTLSGTSKKLHIHIFLAILILASVEGWWSLATFQGPLGPLTGEFVNLWAHSMGQQ